MYVLINRVKIKIKIIIKVKKLKMSTPEGRDNTKVMEEVATTVQSSKANDIYDRS